MPATFAPLIDPGLRLKLELAGFTLAEKLAAADTGDMRWSTRCMANSRDHKTVEAAIEQAARCATGGFAVNNK